jgi:predicted house-cleaning NTP pyrophosphatase (Maf/HAM1 superfamily)
VAVLAEAAVTKPEHLELAVKEIAEAAHRQHMLAVAVVLLRRAATQVEQMAVLAAQDQHHQLRDLP